MSQAILVINTGSSSLKFSVFFQSLKTSELEFHSKGQIEGIGVAPTFDVKDKNNETIFKNTWAKSEKQTHELLLRYLITWLNDFHLQGVKLVAVGHRVVHGGSKYSEPVTVDDKIISDLERLIPLAPLHQPHNLTAIKILMKSYPELLQVACFDTSFHSTNPEVLQHFFIPRDLEKEGVRRYGFHGLSYEYVHKVLAEYHSHIEKKKIIIAHLGSVASMCALNHGKSVTTSMGFTALDGIPMGTRPGTLDVGVVLYLMNEKKMAIQEIETLLYKKSGLLGLSGISNDLRTLESSQDPRAEEALEAYAWRIAQMTGQLAATLEGLDGFVFTAGMGENSDLLRLRICKKLKWLGLELDFDNNKNGRGNLLAEGFCISSAHSKIPVWVIPTNEELMIAQHCLPKLNSVKKTGPK